MCWRVGYLFRYVRTEYIVTLIEVSVFTSIMFYDVSEIYKTLHY